MEHLIRIEMVGLILAVFLAVSISCASTQKSEEGQNSMDSTRVIRQTKENMHSINFAALDNGRFRQGMELHQLISEQQRIFAHTKLGFEEMQRKFHQLGQNITAIRQDSLRDRSDLWRRISNSDSRLESYRSDTQSRIATIDENWSSVREMSNQNKKYIEDEFGKLRDDIRLMEYGTNKKLLDLENNFADHVQEINKKIISLISISGGGGFLSSTSTIGVDNYFGISSI